MNEPQRENEVTYVIVVHGMGEQPKNQTVLNVVNRFAEVRNNLNEKDKLDILTLGQVSGQTGVAMVSENDRPWMEFEDIPKKKGRGTQPKMFLGQSSYSGDHLRFVDLCWSDILEESFDAVGQEVDVWAKGLLGRLLRKDNSTSREREKVPFWIRRMLYLVADVAILLRFIMNFRFKEMKDLVFTKFLGDAQQYGESGHCRGQAVRRFHDIMEKIESWHTCLERESKEHCNNPREARYIIIAHSLGTVMSLDALLFAHASGEVRSDRLLQSKHGWSLEGYVQANDDKDSLPKIDWIQRVRSFVTLGSPIDKYLVVWWLNYRYLLQPKDWFATDQPGICEQGKRCQKIQHFNYCDEQDPVGHNLDIVKKTCAYQAVFESAEDLVFNRYKIPGIAHYEYWTDQELFRWIMDCAVDEDNTTSPPIWFDVSIYKRLLWWTYGVIPATGWMAAYFALSWALSEGSYHATVFAAFAFSIIVLIWRTFIDLSIWGRQIQRLKDKQNSNAKEPHAQKFRSHIGRFALGTVVLASMMSGLAMPGIDLTEWPSLIINPLIVGVAFGSMTWIYLKSLRLEPAYRTFARDGDVSDSAVKWTFGATLLILATAPFIAWGANLVGPYLKEVCGDYVCYCERVWKFLQFVDGQIALMLILAAVAYTYRWSRFKVVKNMLDKDVVRQEIDTFDFTAYGKHP